MSSPDANNPARGPGTLGPEVRPGSRRRPEPPWLPWLRANTGRIALSIPALVLFLGIGGVALAISTNHDTQLREFYSSQATEHLESEDSDRARFCMERMLWLNSTDDATRFKLAQAYITLGQRDRAQGLIVQLAPANETGYAPAHLAVAKSLLSGPDLTPQKVSAAEAQLKHTLNSEPNSLEAQVLLGNIYAQTGRLAEARTQLSMAVNERPDLLLQLAAIERRLGNEAQARASADKGLKIFEARYEEDPGDLDALLTVASLSAFEKNFTRAESLLNTAIETQDTKPLHKGMATLYLAWAEDLLKDPKNPPETWLQVLEKAVQQDPENTSLIDRFQMQMVKSGRNDDATFAALRDMLSKGQAQVSSLFLLGLDAWQHQRLEEAQNYWEEAHKLAPEHGGISNNLAWALATNPKRDLPRALEMINHALEQTPRAPDLLATRGRVLVRMERWNDGLADLEKALAARPNDPDIHHDLADAYTGLSLPDMAATHRRRAEQPQPAPDPGSPNS